MLMIKLTVWALPHTKWRHYILSINYIPDFPLTTIELRFLTSILQDKRVKMFIPLEIKEELHKVLKYVKPLWKIGDIKYFDQNKDGDDLQ